MTRLEIWSLIFIALVSSCCTAKRERKVADINRRISPIETTAFNGTHGALVFAGDGALMRTEDGGATWERVPLQDDQAFKSLCFVDSSDGWAVLERGDVVHTRDGGRIWELLSRLGAPDDSHLFPLHIRFVDSLHGCVVEPSRIWLSEDGGINWERHKPDVPVQQSLFASYFLSPKTGWLIGSGGALFRTDDGGITWDSKHIPLTDDLLDITFSNERVGWISALGGINNRGWHVAVLYRTDDGGDTWQQVTLPVADEGIVSLHFANEYDGWAVGSAAEPEDQSSRRSREVALHTRDGGKNWEQVLLLDQDQESPYQRVFFADSQHGWITTESRVYRTDDGGTTWREVLRLPFAD